MKTGIRIQGGDVDREAVKAVASAVATIFDSAQANGMEQETVRTALNLVGRMGMVESATISGCHVEG